MGFDRSFELALTPLPGGRPRAEPLVVASGTGVQITILALPLRREVF